MRNPYVTGSFVTGEKHYGRQELIDYLLNGDSRACWVLGNRRVGKTSLLRQLELEALAGTRYVPLFWDMQGSDSFRRLGQYLADAVAEHADRFEPLGLEASALAQEDALVLLPRLRRAARQAGRELLLLCDETEVLINLALGAPKSMQRLHSELTAGEGLRIVACSTQAIYGLHDVCQDWPTSPFLSGFDMSQMLGSLPSHSARQLITQAKAPMQVRAAPELIDAISEYTNNHPYLIQLLCSRLFVEPASLRPVAEEDLAADAALDGFFSADIRGLAAADRGILRVVHQNKLVEEVTLAREAGRGLPETRARVHNLQRLGYLRRIYGQIALGNQFLVNWLDKEPAALEATQVAVSDGAMRAALESGQLQEVHFQRWRLNELRKRWVELEAVRARDLLDVSPAVLVEIEQLQSQIQQLRGLLAETQARDAAMDMIQVGPT